MNCINKLTGREPGHLMTVTAGKPGRKLTMSANKQFYAQATLAASISERLDKGCNGDVAPYGTGWLLKTSKLEDTVEIETELSFYRLLAKHGLMGKVTPICDFSESDEDGLVISRINDCMSLRDAASHPALTHGVWLDICLAVAAAVKKSLKAGFFHCDLHSDNVILELVDDCWKAYIIDWALAQHYSEDNILELSWDDWLEEASEGDLGYLVSHLKANKKNPPLWWIKVLEVFE